MKGIKTLADLKRYANDMCLVIEQELIYNSSDIMDVRCKLKTMEECEAEAVRFGIKVGLHTYLWFESDYNLSWNEKLVISDEMKISFNQFYNMANGACQKGYRRYFNWEYKEIYERYGN